MGMVPLTLRAISFPSGLVGESAVGFAAPDHLFAVRVEGVVDDPLGRIELVVVFVTEMTEALGNRVESRPFGLMPERIVGVSSVDDPAEQHQCGIAVELILLDDRLERALLAVMTQFDVRHVVWNSVES